MIDGFNAYQPSFSEPIMIKTPTGAYFNDTFDVFYF